ncbi:MAG TPA: hypothetical protein VHH14_06480, partial [Solirubrobacterales bacterium]|nr:hypothetical protein [Solirubrobacterales bacterium]
MQAGPVVEQEETGEEDLDFWPVWEVESGRAKLAPYVAPRAVALEFGLSVELSKEEEEDKGWAEVDRLRVERLFERLREREIGYGDEAWASREGVQQIRHPWWLLNDRHGTCVDVAATYAGMCLQAQTAAMLAVTDDHAFVVVVPERLRVKEALNLIEIPGFEPAKIGEGIEDFKGEIDQEDPGVLVGSLSTLDAYLADGQLIAVDAVAVTEPHVDFAAAKEAIRKRCAKAPDAPVWLIDVPFLHTQGGFDELDRPPRARPSIRMRVPAAGGRFEDFPAHREVIEQLGDQNGVVALIGESGRGKSTIARRRAERAKFGAAWFLDASDRKALLNSLAMAMQVDIGRPELEVPEAERKALAETALARLADAADPWLVVLDNADGDPSAISDLLPLPKKGQQLLITSTNDRWSAFPGCRAIPLPPIDAIEVDNFRGEEIAELVDGRPLLIDAFRRLDREADWAAADLPLPSADLAPELRGPAVYWSQLLEHPGFGEAELKAAVIAAFMPANAQPVSALENLVGDGGRAVDFLIDRGLFGIDRNLGTVRLHRLFGAVIRADLEASRPGFCDEMVRLLTADESARAALDEHGDLETVVRLDKRLTALDEDAAQPDPGLGLSMHGVGMLLELHGHTRHSGLTFERAERHLMDDPSLRADCLLGRARTINQHHKKDEKLLEEAIGWAREARELKLAGKDEKSQGAAYRALAMEGLLMRPLAKFRAPGEPRDELLDEAQQIIEEADRRRRQLSDDVVPPAEKARSRYNLAGVRIPKAKESPARAAEHLEIANRIYSEVAEWRAEIYGRMVHPHIAACVNGLAIVAYHRAMLLPVDDAQRSAWLREATDHVNKALKQREVLDGPVDGDEATKSAALLAKIALARSASLTREDAGDAVDEARDEMKLSEAVPTPVPPLPSGRAGLPEAIEGWVRSPALREVVGAFGEIPPGDLDLPQLLEWLDLFSDRWDFRKQAERDLETSAKFPLATRKVVEAGAAALGLAAGGVEPKGRYDFVLILGGLARGCISRPLYTARALEDGELEADRIIAIGSFRGNLSKSEVDLLASFAEASADSEFEAMDLGVRRAFELGQPDVVKGEDRESPNASWRVHEYRPEEGPLVQVAAAPSTEPEVRRANTADTLAW